MMIVDLSHAEWQQVMALLANAPWRDANPLLMKIGAQLQAQPQPLNPQQGNRASGDGANKEFSS